MRQSQKRLMENSNLMYECNELRQTKKNLERRIFVLEEQMKVQLREINDIRRGSGSATRNRGQIMGNEEVNVDEVEKEDDMSSLGGSLPQRAMESVDKELFAPPATTLKPPQSVNPSQSLCVVIEIDLLDLIQSEILSLNSDNDSSNTFVITLIEQPLIYTSMF